MERGSAIFSTVEETGIGSAGDIRIATGSLSITNGGNIQSLVRGQGNAGDITIEAIDSVIIDGYSIVGVTDQGVYFAITSSIASGIEDEETADGNGGNISISAGNRITLSNLGSIDSDIKAEDAIGNAGNITLNANVLSLDSNSDINTSTVGQGDAGNIVINAREQILLDNKAEISANTFGRGDAGDIIINARDRVSLDNDAVIGSIAGRNAIGDGGDIQITTGSLSIGGAAQLDTSTFGQGDAGDITIDARGAVSFDGTGRLLDGRIASSGILSTSEGNANGDGGNVQITAESLSLTNGATIGAYSLRQGNAGNITIDVRDRVSLAGVGLDGLSSRISSFTRGIGDGGTIRIVAESVFLTDGTQLTTDTVGQGNAGNVILEVTDQVSLTDGATLSSTVDENGNGNGGNIRIDATSLSVANGSRLNTSTSGVGNAGNISITASDRVVFAGSRNGNISGAFSTVNPEGEGEGGRIRIQTGTLSLIDGSLLQTGTLGRGNAGNIVIEAQDAVMLSGSSQNDRSRIFSGVGETGRGDGGNIRIDTALLSMENSNLFARTQGRGNAGNIRINASDRVLQDRSVISSIVGDPLIGGGIGEGGNVRINTGSLFLTNGSQLQASTFGNGNAGDIVVNARDTVLLDGDLPLSNNRFFRTAAFSIVGVTGNGNGGDIRIRTGSLSVRNGAVISAATTGRGRAGNIWINTRDRVLIDGVGSRSGFSSTLLTSTEQSLSRRGGTITVNTDLFQVTNGAIVNAQTFNRSRGGNIEVHANTFEAIDGGQIITTTSGAGRAGDITLNADRITISGIDSTYGQRLSQNRQRVTNQGAGSGLFANTDINSTGNGGRITVNSNDLTLENGARISAQSQGTGTAGDIRLNALEQLQLTDSDIVTTAPRSSGGDIQVNTAGDAGIVILRGDSDITTNSLGNGGNITLRGAGIIAFDDSDILARSQDARGGNITLDAFFSQNGSLDSEAPFDGNDRVDVNADGELASGTITTPDTSFIQNSLTELPDTAIDTDTLVANSCVVRSEDGGNTFTITGTGGLPLRPGDRPLLPYGTNPVRSVPDANPDDRSWQPGDAIVEPQGAYQLKDGRMVLSRECE
jgi:large exoprotein involved in heme utilization and adhesion